MDTFPAIAPHDGSSPGELAPRVQRNQFGDGYSQRVPLGINILSHDWTLSYTALSATNWATISAFLEDHSDGEAFYYTPYGESAVRVFTALKWSPIPRQGNVWDVSISLTEEFDL